MAHEVPVTCGHAHLLVIASVRTWSYLLDWDMCTEAVSLDICRLQVALYCTPTGHLIARHRTSAKDGCRARTYTSFRSFRSRLGVPTRVLPRELRTESRWLPSQTTCRLAWVGCHGEAKMRAVICGQRSRCQRQLRLRLTASARRSLRSVTSLCCL